MVARNDQQRFNATLDELHLGLMLALPAAVALWLLAEPGGVMFASFGGAMTAHDVVMAAAAPRDVCSGVARICSS